MTYAKFDDRCPEHPKIAALSDRDFRAWFESICYCARNLTDGFVPAAVLVRLWRRNKGALLDAGVWETAPGGVHVHDYLDWNDSRETVERRIERSRKGGVAKAASSTAPSTTPSTTPGGASSTSRARAPGTAQPPAQALPSSPLLSAPNELTPERLGPPSANGRRTREPDEVFEAVVEACGWAMEHLTKDARGRANAAAAQLRELEARPALIRGFGIQWRMHYPDTNVTPQTITSHWADYMASNLSTPARRRR